MWSCRLRPSGVWDGVVVKRMALLGSLGFLTLAAGAARAVDGTWLGPGGEWTTGSNWSSAPQVPDGTATFTNNSAPTSVTISNNASIGTMDFSAATQTYSFTVRNGATFTLNSSVNPGAALFPNFAVDAGSSLVIADTADAALGSLGNGASGGGTVIIGPTNSAAFLTLTPSSDATFSGSFSGAGSLELSNTSTTLTLTGASNGGNIGTIGGDLTLCNCFGGGLTISGGRLTVSGLSQGVFVDGGTLSVINGGVLQDNLDLLVSSSMLVSGAGSTVNVAGFTGVGIFAPGNLTISNGGTLNSLGGAEIDSFFGTPSVTVTGSGSAWNVGAGGLAIGGGTSGGPGTLSISDGGKVTVTGATGISSGSTLTLGTGGLSGSIVTPAITNDGAIVANFTDTLTLAANISGSGTLSERDPAPCFSQASIATAAARPLPAA